MNNIWVLLVAVTLPGCAALTGAGQSAPSKIVCSPPIVVYRAAAEPKTATPQAPGDSSILDAYDATSRKALLVSGKVNAAALDRLRRLDAVARSAMDQMKASPGSKAKAARARMAVSKLSEYVASIE